MTEKNLDPRLEQLVAYLYSELDEREAGEFRKLLETDPALRANWEELREAREFLAQLREEAPAPEFVFLRPIDEPVTSTRSTPAKPRFARFLAPLRPALSPAWAMGTAAAGLAALVVLGLRVDRVDDGLLVRFGAPEKSSSVQPAGETPVLPAGEPAASLGGTPLSGLRAAPVSQRGDWLTEKDLQSYGTAMMNAMASIIEERERRSQSEMAYALRGFYEEIRSQQLRSEEDLRARIEGVGLGLMAEQSRTNARLTALVNRDGRPVVSETPRQKNNSEPLEPERKEDDHD